MKRYDYTGDGMLECPDGDYVRAEDAVQLSPSVRAAEIATLTRWAELCETGHGYEVASEMRRILAAARKDTRAAALGDGAEQRVEAAIERSRRRAAGRAGDQW